MIVTVHRSILTRVRIRDSARSGTIESNRDPGDYRIRVLKENEYPPHHDHSLFATMHLTDKRRHGLLRGSHVGVVEYTSSWVILGEELFQKVVTHSDNVPGLHRHKRMKESGVATSIVEPRHAHSARSRARPHTCSNPL